MFEAFLATTSSEGLSALGSREQRSFELISDTVRDALGDAHAALFAEPVATEHGDRFDWYAAVQGKVRKLTELDEEEASAVRARKDQLCTDVNQLAQKFIDDETPDGLRLGEALRNAIQVPGDNFIYVVGEGSSAQPVLINWAWTDDDHRFERGVLAGSDNRKAAANKAAAAAAAAEAAKQAEADEAKRVAEAERKANRTPFVWLPWLLGLGWLLLALMIAAIIWLLIAPCSLRGPSWLNSCPTPPASASLQLAYNATLEDEIDQLERRIAIADRACQPPPPEPEVVQLAPPPPPEPAEEEDIQNRLRDAGALRGDLNFSLAWDGSSDVDIAVTCPNGQTIKYNNKLACNGQLDVDSNSRQNNIRPDPVENIFFNNPAPGRYTVTVTLFTKRQSSAVPFDLLIRDASGSKVENGTLEVQKQRWTTTFNYAGSQ